MSSGKSNSGLHAYTPSISSPKASHVETLLNISFEAVADVKDARNAS